MKTKSSIASQRKQPPVEEEFLEIEAKADNEVPDVLIHIWCRHEDTARLNVVWSQNTLDRLGAALTATENKLNEQQHAAPAKAAAADAVVPQTAAATASSEQAEDPAVEKALKDAAEAKATEKSVFCCCLKSLLNERNLYSTNPGNICCNVVCVQQIQAMAAQQKALAAGATAKAAAAQVHRVPAVLQAFSMAMVG